MLVTRFRVSAVGTAPCACPRVHYVKVRARMLRHKKFIRLPLIGMTIVGVVVALYLFAGKRSSKPGPASRIRKHTVKTSPQDALKYWTEEKMRKTKGVEMPRVNQVEPKKEQPRRSPDAE